MKAGPVSVKDLKEVKYRFDPSYHINEGQLVKALLSKSPYGLQPISSVSNNIFYGGRAKRIYVASRNFGIPFLSSSDILQNDVENVKLVSKKYTVGIEEMRLQRGWTLVSRSGTIGNCAFVDGRLADKLASEHVMRVCPNSSTKEGLLYAYLASNYGHTLLTQGSFGAVIQHIEPDFIGNLPIPNFPDSFQKEVDDLVQQSATLREQAAAKLDEAVKYFDEQYQISPDTQQIFTKKVNNLPMGFASYNNNLEVDAFIETYKSHSVKLANITTKVFAPPLFKHIYLNKDNGFPFMTGSELSKFNLRYYRWLSPRGVKDINDYIVRKGTLLLYKSGTTDGGILGNVFIADDQLDGCCLSDHVIRVVFKDEKMALWTFAFLKSKGSVRMLQRLATGTMIPFITPERLSELFIPTPDDKYDEIASLIEDYVKLISQSKQDENKAITMVEQEIEKWQSPTA